MFDSLYNIYISVICILELQEKVIGTYTCQPCVLCYLGSLPVIESQLLKIWYCLLVGNDETKRN